MKTQNTSEEFKPRMKVEPIAICFSERCCRPTENSVPKGITIKVSRGTVFCPECSNALFWKVKEAQ